jgi:cytochrome c553
MNKRQTVFQLYLSSHLSVASATCGLLRLVSIAVGLSFVPMVRAAAPDNAAQIVAQGNGRGAPACITCHGTRGEGSSAFPRLAGTGKAYLQAQLDAFGSGARKNSTMQSIAKQLSTEERGAVAAYYSELPSPKYSLSSAMPTPADVGAWIANRGRWSDNVPACVQCHGPGGSGVGQHFPPLAGLPPAYLAEQLQAWRSGTRPPGPLGLMATIASKLSVADSQAVANYYGGQANAKPVITGSSPPRTSESQP